jgi:hypothetical protein
MSEKDACNTEIWQGDVEIFCGLTGTTFEKLKSFEKNGNTDAFESWKSTFVLLAVTCLDVYEKEKECEKKSKIIPYIVGSE